MGDMNSVIAPKSDQINADDLIGGDMIITITEVKIRQGEDQPVSMHFEGSRKVYRPCKSMSRVIVAIWGADTANYAGRSIKLYRDPDVQWGGMKVGGIRIREMTHMEGDRPVTLALTEKRGSRKPAVIRPLIMPQNAAPAPRAAETAAAPAAGRDAARAAARSGTEAFRAWWNSEEGKSARQVCAEIMAELKQLCAAADEAISRDPFGLPPIPQDGPTPEQLAAAEAAAVAAIRAQDAGQ